jgi:hypothetical protein
MIPGSIGYWPVTLVNIAAFGTLSTLPDQIPMVALAVKQLLKMGYLESSASIR